METHTFFLQLMLILLTARVFAETAIYLNAPPVIGELIAGIILGPSLLGWLEPTEVIKLLAEIGVILLLFEVGLETNVSLMKDTGAKSGLVALTGFSLPFLFGFSLCYLFFNLNLLTSLFVGGTLTATSIGITVRVLADLGRQHSLEGRIVLGAAVMDDIMGVVLLAILFQFSIGAGINIASIGQIVIFVAIFFLSAPAAAKILALIIQRFDEVSELPGLIPTTIISLVLFFAWLAHFVGAPALLGGFAAGLALSRRFILPFGAFFRIKSPEFTDRILEQIKPIVRLFTPIFFVMVGLSLNLKVIDWGSFYIWSFSLSLFVLSVLGKLIGGWLVPLPGPIRWVIGLAMVPRGEVGLIFAELGYISGILPREIHAGLIIVIAFTTLLSPFAIKWTYKIYGDKITS
jgi:Kef-type K+ transport system membrane component KefB